VQFCNSSLDEAKSRVELLLKKDGQLVTVPFAEEDSGD
jgi:exonuclease VII small subunit